MSKEMTPKEAFQSLVEIYDITKSSKQCKIINKALNSVEETKTNYHTALAFCEASKEEKQELYKQIKQLEKENQDLRDKLNINFEDCADELCEALTQRDKLYDENLELQKENQELKEDLRLTTIERTNCENTFEELEEKYLKLKKVIDILKNKANIRLHILTNTDGSKIYEIEFILGYYSTIHEITQQEYELLKEVLENV